MDDLNVYLEDRDNYRVIYCYPLEGIDRNGNPVTCNTSAIHTIDDAIMIQRNAAVGVFKNRKDSVFVDGDTISFSGSPEEYTESVLLDSFIVTNYAEVFHIAQGPREGY